MTTYLRRSLGYGLMGMQRIQQSADLLINLGISRERKLHMDEVLKTLADLCDCEYISDLHNLDRNILNLVILDLRDSGVYTETEIEAAIEYISQV